VELHILTGEIKREETERKKNRFRPLRDRMKRYYRLREQLLART
jgi:uncharacterized membrane protein YkvA (DUF1232 family)